MTNKSVEPRPDIAGITSGGELKRWYWLKTELASHAKAIGLKTAGAKFDILERIAHFLDTGETRWPGDERKTALSKFDWHSAILTHETVITDSYKNSQNVRRFFAENTGPDFKFTIAFMDWIKANTGKTLGDALAEYQAQSVRANTPGYKTKIKSHNQFNQYCRDILDHSPELTMKEVRRIWALKRALPMEDGRHVFEVADLELKGG